MATLTQQINKLTDEHNQLENEVIGIRHTLKGNGSIGIYDQIKEVRKEQKAMGEELQAFKRKMLYGFITIGLISTGSLVGNNAEVVKLLVGALLK